MKMLRWLVDLHPDFPASGIVLEHLKQHHKPDPIVIDRREVMLGKWPDTEDWIVGYGTMFTMTRLLRHPSLGTAIFDDYLGLRCSKYYSYIYHYLGRSFLFAPFGVLPHLPLHKMFGDRVFVRPDSNYKLFPATVLTTDQLTQWVKTYAQHQHELAVVSEVVSFEAEYRCFCRNGVFFCGSSYPNEPYSEVPDEIRGFAEDVARVLEVTGTNMLTVDIGLHVNEPKIVEIGGVNSWGIYGSNVDDFIDAMEEEAAERWQALAE